MIYNEELFISLTCTLLNGTQFFSLIIIYDKCMTEYYKIQADWIW